MASQDQMVVSPRGSPVDAEPASPIRADDFEAMKKAYMLPDPHLEVLEECSYTWNITDWRPQESRPSQSTPQAELKRYSDLYECSGEKWRILLFPTGNNSDTASVYLENAGEEHDEDWHHCVQFMLVMWNPREPTIFSAHFARHRFTREVRDWGFTKFADLRRLFNINWENHNRPMIEDETVNITVYHRLYEDPTGVLWHDWINYDSKKATGMVGLRNQGATCYLNSLVQSLYFTPCFRQAVFQIPTDPHPDDGDQRNSTYALQKLFYLLNSQTEAVSTAELTSAFGWNQKQIIQQQDVQELSRILMERLEEKMKGTEAEKALSKMFVGKMKTFISCINVDYVSSRIEEFWDIQLNVSGNNTLDDSFRDYIQVETMDGDNKYDADNHGLQDARKGIIFNSFPQILNLHLKRFEYDYNTDMMMKINDRYEFPDIWDASPYLSEDADKSEPWTYRLFAVLVHSGDVNAGHYYAFIRPEKGSGFYLFDDDRVTKSTLREAMDENFGGELGMAMQRNPYTGMRTRKSSTNAYMLVYFRESRIDEIMLGTNEIEAPLHLETHRVLVATNKQFSAHQGFDIVPWITRDGSPSHPKLFHVHNEKTFTEFYQQMATEFGYDPKRMRAWLFMARRNETVRPDHPIDTSGDVTIDKVWKKYVHGPAGSLRIWLEEAEEVDEKGGPVWPVMDSPAGNSRTILLFLKVFDPFKQELFGFKHIYISNQEPMDRVAARVREMLGWPVDTPVQMYEEIKKDMIDEIYPNMATRTLNSLEIQDGDIVTVMKTLTMDESSALTEKDYYLTPPSYYHCLNHQIELDLKPMDGFEGEEANVLINGLLPYSQWAAKLSERLGRDPEYVHFYSLDGVNGRARGHLQSPASLENAMAPFLTYRSNHQPRNATMYYEEVSVPMSELHNHRYLRVQWLRDGIQKTDVQYLWVHKDAQVSDIQQQVCKKAELEPEVAPLVRLFESRANVVSRVLEPEMVVARLAEASILYAELTPEDERVVDDDMALVFVFHFHQEPLRTHNVPFVFYARKGESFSDTRKRLLRRTGMSEKEFEKVRFAIIPKVNERPHAAVYLGDDDVLYDKMQLLSIYGLGLDHVAKVKQNTRTETITIR